MKVTQDKDQQKFFLTNNGKESYVLYRITDRTMDIYRTYVPPEQRNQGLAAKVVKASLDYAKENNLKVIPSCSYTDYFIEMNSEYEELRSPL